jgi:hypothetical protein
MKRTLTLTLALLAAPALAETRQTVTTAVHFVRADGATKSVSQTVPAALPSKVCANFADDDWRGAVIRAQTAQGWTYAGDFCG